MQDWTSGYISEIGYTFGYYSELNPSRASLALINAGFSPNSCGVHCELGFGQGISANLHAASSSSTWYGTDFNSSQAAFSLELAKASGADIHLYDQSFPEFCTRSDLPDFDSISLHGIWSWISNENRAIILNFIRKKLKVGGLLYISYNTLPGWANFAPLRQLMTQHSEINGASGNGVVQNVNGSLKFLQSLMDTSPLFDRANPQARERFLKVSMQDRRYLAHEYFNKDWHPMYFADVANSLESAKLQFACSAHYLDHIESINFSSQQINFLNSISNLNFRETIKDYMVNQQFRRDYWIKGPIKLNPLEKIQEFRKIKIILIIDISEVLLKVRGPAGEATLNKEIYETIIENLINFKIITIFELERKLKNKNITIQNIIQAVVVLLGLGYIALTQAEETTQKIKNQTDNLNQYLINKAKVSGEINYLASPVIGGGVSVGRFQQLFLLSMTERHGKPEECAQYAWTVLSDQNQRIVIDGKTLETPEENLSELTRQSVDFQKKRLPILKSLGVA